MIENTNTKQFYPGPILNNTLEITDFLFNDAEQIKIKHSKLNDEGILVDIDLNYPTDYEVTKVLPSDINAAEAALTASTGQIMLKNVNVLAGEKLTVYRVSQIVQDKDYPRTGAFPAATHEGALDYLTMQNQEQKDEIDRALKVPISTQNFEGSLPLPVPSRALKINNDGTGFEMSEFDPDVALVTTEEFKNQAQQAAAEALASRNAAAQRATIATQQAGIATQQANIATEKTAEVVESGITAVQNIDTAFGTVNDWFTKLNALPYIPVGTILPTTGAIDESLGYQRYANGQLIAGVSTVAPDLVTFLEYQELHAPNLLCSEIEWQTALTLSTLGQVGKYVWNKEEDSVRIPRIVNIQGMMDMNTVGDMVEAGLPNITGALKGYLGQNPTGAVTSSGAFNATTTANPSVRGTSEAAFITTTFDASRSSSIYKEGATVQEESILYPYVLQIAAGVQYRTPVINEIELNNPYSLLDVKWSDKLLNNISWLRSEGQANSKAVHNDVYELILKEYNSSTDETEIVNGVSITFRRGVDTGIKVTTDKSAYDSILSATGTAWYYVLEQDTEIFYLPQSDGFLQFGGSGEFVEAGLPDHKHTLSLYDNNESGKTSYLFYENGKNLRTFNTSNASSSNSIYGNSDTVQPNAVKGYLYFYVGETVQNANLINAGRIEEKLTLKADKTEVDGEWVVMLDFTPLVANLNMNSSTYLELDLTDFLPKDNYAYECNLSATITTSSTSGNAIYISLATPQSPNNWFDLCQARTRTSSTMNAMGSSIIPVGTDRKIILYRGTNINGTLNSLKLNAYRRLGKIGV